MSDLVPVLRATVEVTDWYSLGLELGLPDYQLERIRRDGYDETDCQRKMTLKWMDTGVASWSSLVEALKSPLINKNGVAEQITKDNPRKYYIITCKQLMKFSSLIKQVDIELINKDHLTVTMVTHVTF